MKLTRVERWILSNQLRILAQLHHDDPAAAEDYERAAEGIERGFVHEYDRISDLVDERELSDEGCREVLDILEMFRALQDAKAGSAPGSDEQPVTFMGFDARDESKQLAYARYVRADQRFDDVRCPRADLNSHTPKLPQYRKQLVVWRASDDPHKLTKTDVAAIAAVAKPFDA